MQKSYSEDLEVFGTVREQKKRLERIFPDAVVEEDHAKLILVVKAFGYRLVRFPLEYLVRHDDAQVHAAWCLRAAK